MTFIATPIIADNLLRIDTRRNRAIFYFPRGEIAIGVLPRPPTLRRRGRRGEGRREISQRKKKKGGKWCNASKGALKGDRVEKENERRERFYIYIHILPLANSNRAGGAKRVKSSGARNR